MKKAKHEVVGIKTLAILNSISKPKTIRPAFLLNVKNVRKKCHQLGRHAGRDFLKELDIIVEMVIQSACRTWDGNHKRLSGSLIPKKYK